MTYMLRGNGLFGLAGIGRGTFLFPILMCVFMTQLAWAREFTLLECGAILFPSSPTDSRTAEGTTVLTGENRLIFHACPNELIRLVKQIEFGTSLNLNSLTALSPKAAGPLSKCKGKLILNGLQEITTETAKRLLNSMWLHLGGFTDVPDELSNAFSDKCKGMRVCLMPMRH